MPASSVRLPIDDAGVLFGVGFFETFRTSGGRPHHWRFHRARLARACDSAGIALPPTFLSGEERRLREVVGFLLRDNGMSEAVCHRLNRAGVEAAL